MKIVLLGPPASGKDTQGEILSKKLGIPHIGMGNLLWAVPKDSPLGKTIRPIIERGENVSAEIAMELLLRRIESAENGYILNNFPRSTEQLAAWKKYLEQTGEKIDVVIVLEIPSSVGVERMSNRRERVRSPRVRRYDESDAVIRQREKVGYAGAAQEILAFYREHSRLVTIDGTQSIEAVARDIWDALHDQS